MTTNTNWRDRIKMTYELSGGHWVLNIDGEEVKRLEVLDELFKSIEDQALKDQKAELLKRLPKEIEHPFFPNEHEYGLNDAEADGFNDCLEIIKGLIKGE
ncbi:MAG: hypothetical protein UW18_C0017G0003 [Microgenomates group bacterium GW2011_GWF1_44_10]|nr:MAG: hypothetical protein UW18_C0017G0003 [Microgenomates group bacterium GW2011_GWF1_44_10]